MGISIIIPCYKQAQYIREAIESILASSGPLEIIIVDDCDPHGDDIRLALAGLEDHVKLIRLKTNRGLAGARNAGIALATGELILPLDADDKLNDGAISRLKQALSDHPEADVAYGYLQEFGEGRGIWGHLGGWPLRALLEANKLPYASLFRKSAWERVSGYDENMRDGYEDWDFWLKLATTGSQFACVNTVTLLYRVRADSMYQRARLKHNDIVAYMQAKYADYFVKSGAMRRRIELPASFDIGRG